MSKGLVLISGVNGYIAAVSAKALLDAGYSVRGTVRKQSSAEPLISGPLKDYASSGAFTIVEVPDITVPGAFDEAVKGVTSIAHLASPVSFNFSDPDPIIHAAVEGTKTMLNSALKAGPQLESFILLSSIVAIMNGAPAPYTLTEKDWNGFAEAQVKQSGKDTPGVITYMASKTAGERALWAFRDEKKPSFTVTALNPVFVIGPPLIPPPTASAVGETIHILYKLFSGAPIPGPGLYPGLGHVVDVRDVAAQLTHIVSDPKPTNGERYISRAAFNTAQATVDVLREAFPEAKGRIQEGTPGEGYVKGEWKVEDKANVVDIDGGKAKSLLKGGEYIDLEKSLVDTAKAFVHLV